MAMDLDAGPASMEARMSPTRARRLARALLDAADIVDAFEALKPSKPNPPSWPATTPGR